MVRDRELNVSVLAKQGRSSWAIESKVLPPIAFLAYKEPNPLAAGQYREAISRVVESLGMRRVKDLELLATTYFLSREVDGRTQDNRAIVQAVLGLKPHFTGAEVELAVRELDQLVTVLRS